jgi:beta-lactamase class D
MIKANRLRNGTQNWTHDQNADKWIKYSKEKLNQTLNREFNSKKAKNIIMFLGDGSQITNSNY